ncbi:MAG: hypothetical protein AB7P03_17550 [Kofleriaceae bacterium]
MKRRLVTAASAILIAVPLGACSTETGSQGSDASLLAAVPDHGFTGGSTSIVLSGSGTSFTNASAIDFGEGITVTSVMATSGSNLLVEITTATDAPLGPRTITVDGHSLENGFTIASPIEIEVLGTTGKPAQGSVSTIMVKNLDMSSPFDVTTDEQTGTLKNLTVSYSGAGGSVIVNDATPFELEIALLLGPNATPGAATIDIERGPAATAQLFQASVEVVSRTPIALGAGGTITGALANGYDSVLYELSAAQLTAVHIPVPATAGAAILVLGPSGSVEEPIGAAYVHPVFGPIDFSNNVTAGAKIYVIFHAGGDPAGFDYSFDVDLLAASTTIAHVEPNNTKGTAQVVTAPGAVVDASFTSDTDEDWYAVQVAAADVGKPITAVTGGYGGANTAIQIFAPDGTTSISGDGPTDVRLLDRVTSAATTTAGAHYVKVTQSHRAMTMPDDSEYTVVIALD